MEIVSNIPFEPYLRKIIEVTKCNPLEINYQLEIIKPLLEMQLPEYQVPDTSNNSEPTGANPKHNRYYYTLKNRTAPDLLIAKNYTFVNRNSVPNIYVAIEIKRQSSDEMFNRELVHEEPSKEYSIHLVNELATYMCVNDKAIATNCRRWQFFNKSISKIFDVSFLKEYLSVAALLIPITRKEFKTNSSYYIDELWKKIAGNKQLGKVCTATDESERNEQWYAASVLTLENCCREMVNSCLCKTIDALPNYGVISEEQFSESIEPDEFVKDLIGLYTQSVIKTPKEWYELIEYIPQFVENP